MTHRFKLSFNAPKKGDPPFAPMWHIYVAHGGANEEGFQSVTSTSCMEGEIDYEIDNLNDELNSLRKKAKNKYKSWNEKMAKQT